MRCLSDVVVGRRRRIVESPNETTLASARPASGRFGRWLLFRFVRHLPVAQEDSGCDTELRVLVGPDRPQADVERREFFGVKLRFAVCSIGRAECDANASLLANEFVSAQ
jgi:hypothetical protein